MNMGLMGSGVGWVRAGGEVGISSRERLAQTLLAAPILKCFLPPMLCYVLNLFSW